MIAQSMITVRNLNLRLGADRRPILRDVSFRVAAGEAFGLVGESGAGKTTVLRILAGLLGGWSGEVSIAGVTRFPSKVNMLPTLLQMVFQDPLGSLHPGQRVGRALAEAVAIHGLGDGDRRIDRALSSVGLGPEFRARLPHELSGGQRQRVGIARALMLEPKILLLDEPTSSLDVSIQAEVVNLLMDLRRQHGLTYVLVSHNLPLVAHICGRLAVMRAGEIVEELTAEDLRAGRAQRDFTREFIAASRGYEAA